MFFSDYNALPLPDSDKPQLWGGGWGAFLVSNPLPHFSELFQGQNSCHLETAHYPSEQTHRNQSLKIAA